MTRAFWSPWADVRLPAPALERHCARCRVLDLPYETPPGQVMLALASAHPSVVNRARAEAAKAAAVVLQMFEWAPENYVSPPQDPFSTLLTGSYDHYAFWGGRGGSKSWGTADAIVELCSTQKERVAGAREHMVRIKESSKELLDAKVRASKWAKDWVITEYELRNSRTGSVIFFVGLSGGAGGPEGVAKALEGITLLWTDEAQLVSKRSLEVILPTIRQAGSRCVWTWNPGEEPSPVDKLFRGGEPPERSHIQSVMLEDNPYLYRSRLMAEARGSFRRDSEATYRHIWRGAHLEITDATIFAHVESAYLDWTALPCRGRGEGVIDIAGMDFGYGGADPSVAIKASLILPSARADGGTKPLLYVEFEAVGHAVPNHELWRLPRQAKIRGQIFCDSANPLMIDALNAAGTVFAQPAKKGAGSVLAGIRKMQSCEVWVALDCPVALEELRGLRWTTDPRTGKIKRPLATVGEDHTIAALRYALSEVELTEMQVSGVDWI